MGQLRSDVLRLELVHRFGGVYIDSDFESCKSIEPLIEDAECFVARVDDLWLNNAIVGATPRHAFLEALIERLPASVATNRGFKPNRMTGPQFLTKVHAGRSDVQILPAELFYPYRWDDLEGHTRDYPEAYAIHHWHNQRREKGVPAP